MVKQVKNQIHCISSHLLNYKNWVRELLKYFDEFSINSIPRNQNSVADLLANVSSKLIPLDDLMTTCFSVQLLFRPSVLDNITNFRIFDDDDQIINFQSLKKSLKLQLSMTRNMMSRFVNQVCKMNRKMINPKKISYLSLSSS